MSIFSFSPFLFRNCTSTYFGKIQNKNKLSELLVATKNTFCNSAGKMKKSVRYFNIPHSPKDPPDNYHPMCVEHEAFEVPDFLPASAFRPFRCPEETLGPNAHKDGCYKNPEYFGYHRYSFVTLQICALKIIEEQSEGGIQCVVNYGDEDTESESDNDGTTNTGC